MKEIRKCLMMMLVFVSIIAMASGCGKKEQMATTPDSDDWRDMQIIMHGVRIKDIDTMMLEDLYDFGFKKDLISTFLVTGNWVEPGESTIITLLAKDGSIGGYDIRVMNFSDKKVSVDHCEIVQIYISGPDSSREIVHASDIYLANGVVLGMTPEEVRTIMGEPTSEDIFEGEDVRASISQVMRYNTDKEKRNGINFAFDVDDGKVKMIILNF